MDPFYLTGWLLVIVILTMCVAYFVPRKKAKAVYGTDDGQPDAFYRDGGITGYGARRDGRVTFGKRNVGKHPALGAPYGQQSSQRVVLTPRQVERINIQRKLRGKPPFNRTGLTNAIAHPWDRYDVRQPQNTNDWLSYLIMYEIIFSDHQAHTVGGCGGVAIDPGAPYNGQGGEFAGAGASGSWGDPVVRAQATAIEIGIPFASDADPKYSPGDTVGGYGSRSFDVVTDKPDPSPVTTYAPDPSPSPTYSASSVSDSGSSYSSSSSDSSSSSSDSGSSSSGGGGD